MRFLILGASGMAGHTICLYLQEQGHEVKGFSRTPTAFVPSIVGDALDRDILAKTVIQGNYDIVVNAIGILNQDADARKDVATYLNAYLPHALAAMTFDLPTRIFHMSTDCVFAGNTGPYSESALPDGMSFYDRSKALGELRDSKNLTLRNSIVGPDINPNGIGLLNWFMKQKEPIKGFTHAMWTGLTTLELAKAMEACALDGSTGLVNMVPEGNISKFDLLQLFNTHLHGGKVDLSPVDEPILDKTLIRTNLDSSFRPALYETQIREMADWIKDHKQLYPHYELEQV